LKGDKIPVVVAGSSATYIILYCQEQAEEELFMKTFSRYPLFGTAVVVLVLITVLFSGCTSPTDTRIPAVTGPPGVPAGQGAPAPASTMVSTSLPYGVTIPVPADWTRQDVLTGGVRDYGTTTLGIASFFSPDAIPGDKASHTSLSVDLDQNPGADFEKYFNNATIAVTKTYGDPTTVEAHSYTIPVSGYKSYELDFQTAEVKGTYIFTSTENGMYIFAFRVPNKPLAVQMMQKEIVGIYSSIRINPPTVVVTR
jgi:hypothetical protein